MKRILLPVIALALLTACNSKPKTELDSTENFKVAAVYGDSVKENNVIELAALTTAMKGEEKKDLKIRGKVEEVCQKKGCWMVMKLGNGEDMRITFKDYKFFVPKDLAGKEVVMEGYAYLDTTSVKQLQHYAKDGGKSDAEIAAIVSPKTELAFEAKGVAVMN
ncbi:DUF4920 domain-containing protein [Daejeonella lutea]|uniref:DUF4920 domain-containing protein n=1 Tax=Daejeonella lutea TaxID=572036 RepID=A0A1T5DH01_9SPHI|nr:DUF4920 domain-containing protein [Daejeonella lutea]SKB71028.1 protein of unknown function [Daejeonella lutea]